jgi:catechol 2,3-dioxygenase-like lactoylglutathione lyase family enzyme
MLIPRSKAMCTATVGAYVASSVRGVQVRNIRWVGIPTDRYDETVAFLRDVLGLKTNFEEPATIELETTEGDEIQVFAPGEPYYDFFKEHAQGPVPLFEVDDVHAARAELDAAGIEIVGPPGRDSNWEWIHVRGPDGNLYELASRLDASLS